MSQKRQPDDGKVQSEENSSSDDKRRRVRNVFMEAMRMHSVQNFLEPLIRRVVKEEVESALRKHLNSMKRNSDKVVHPSESSNLQLQFSNSLSLPVFTGTRIEAEDCSTIRISLIDALSGQIVDFGPVSSVKVEIVVLEGDFDGDEGDNWTLEEFKNNIVKEREGKKPLLTGEVFLNLKEGVGVVGEISFTDNSSWTRSRKFRLGARVVDNSDDTRIREAKSESFIVRDHRGELYKKHHPPSLLDEVWRLEKIGKEGAFHKRLNRENIITVKDFLTLFFIDPSRLRNILGSGMSAKMWEVTVDHARTCTLDKRIYLYSPLGSQSKTNVVFNVVGQVMGLLLEQHQYAPVDNLSETEKAEAQTLVVSAYKHWEEVVSFDDEASLLSGSSSHSPDVLYPSSMPTTEVSNSSKSLNSHKIGKIGFSQPSPSSSDIISSIYPIDECTLQGIDNMDLSYETPYGSFPSQVTNSMSSMICDIESMTQVFYDDDHLGFFESDCPLQHPSLGSPSDLHRAVDKFCFVNSTPAVDKAQRRWRMLFNVLKWFSVRRHVALKKAPIRETHRRG